jgi:general secretion pathway protein D
MKRFTGVLALLLVLAVSVLASSDKQAKALYQKGKLAEARQDYISAYNFYHQAYQLKPTDLTYRSSYEYVRFLAAAAYVHQGQILLSGGKLQEALTDFEQALAIDPSSFIAQQEANKARLLIQKNQSPSATPSPPGMESELDKRMEQATGPVELAPISQTPITLNLTQDSKTVYESIGKLAGINVLFDPDYTSKKIRVDLNGVTLQEALVITALESKTFWRPVTPNTIFVAADTAAKRKELEQSVIRTFYLSNLSMPNELQDMVNILRTLLDTQRLQQFPSQQAIVVRGTPDQIVMAGKLIEDLDKSKPEVVVEVAIMQVTRDKLRNLGINPPASVSVQLQQNAGTTTTSTTSSTTTGTTTPASTANTGISLNTLANLNATNFAVTIPQATANFLMTDSSSKLIQQPEIRASDGQKASLKIGERVPVATGSFQPGIGGVGINPLVNTQFNYIDVGVNIDITPHVHGIDDVSLKLAMDISDVDSYQNIGGINQPVIGQRKLEGEIRMKEGEVNILGGIMEETTTYSLSGIPGLASIPLFKYLFAEQQKEVNDNEIVFILIPHIVRAQEINPSNLKTIDVGTANVISLRRDKSQPNNNNGQSPQGQPGSPQGATSNPAQPGAPQVQPQGNPAPAASVQPAAASAPLGSAIVSFDPPTLDQPVGSTFTVNVNLTGGQNVFSVPLQIMYNPRVLQVLNVSNGTLLSQDGQTVALVNRDDSMAGILQVTASRPPGTNGISGDGSVFTLTFQARTPGQSTLSINRAALKNAAMQSTPASGSQAIVTVH